MADTVRTVDYLLTSVLQDGQTAGISAQDLRDTVVSVVDLIPAPGDDISDRIATATGGTIARTLAGRAADVFNVLDYGVSPSGTAAANRAALQALAVTMTAHASGRGEAVMYFPSGRYDVADGEILFQSNGIAVKGDGPGASIIRWTSGSSNLFRFKPRATDAYAAGISVCDIKITTSDNPTAGGAVVFDHVQQGFVRNAWVDGGFYNLDCISCLSVHIDGFMSLGNNTSSGATMMQFRRLKAVLATSGATASGSVLPFSSTIGVFVGQTVTGTNIPASTTVASFTGTSVTLSQAISGSVAGGASITFADINNSENVIHDVNLRSTARSYTNALRITNSDGIIISDSHIGFSSAEAVLVKPLYTDDQITGVYVSNSQADTGQYGWRFSGSGGVDTGTRGNHGFSGAVGFISDLDGMLFDDSTIRGVHITGFKANNNGRHGINIQAGQGFAVTGGNWSANNAGNQSGSDVLIGGDTAFVGIGGPMRMAGGGATPVLYHLAISDTSNDITINWAGMVLTGAATGDYSATTSGTRIRTTGQGISSFSTKPWIGQTSGAGTLAWQSTFGATMFDLNTSSVNAASQWWRANARGSPSGPELFPVDSGGAANVNATVRGRGTGRMAVGATTNTSVDLLAPVIIGAIAASATPSVGAVSGVVNAQFSTAGDQRTSVQYHLYATASAATAVRLTTDGTGTATSANCANLTSNNTKATVRSVTLTATNVTTPSMSYSYYLSMGQLSRQTGVGSTVWQTPATPLEQDQGTVTGRLTSITADTANAGLNISWTPPTGNTDTWHVVASMNMDILQ